MSTQPAVALEDALVSWVIFGTGLASGQVVLAPAPRRPAGMYASISVAMLPPEGVDEVRVEENPLVFADKSFTASAATNRLTMVAHGLQTGDGPVEVEGVDLPAPLAEDTNYWIVRDGADVVRLATSFLDSMATVPVVVDLADAGTAPQALVSIAATRTRGAEISRVASGPRLLAVTIQVFGAPGNGESSPLGVLSRLVTSRSLPSQRARLRAGNCSVLRLGGPRDVGGRKDHLFEPRSILDVTISCTSELSETMTYVERVRGENEDTGDTFEVELT